MVEKDYWKKYYEGHKEVMINRAKEYYTKNREKIRKRVSAYYQKNKDKLRAKRIQAYCDKVHAKTQVVVPEPVKEVQIETKPEGDPNGIRKE